MLEIGEIALTPRETGAGLALKYLTRDITVSKPFSANSIEKPENVTLQTYHWENPDAVDPKGACLPQIVCIGGLASEPIEIFANMEAWKNSARTIIGVSHPNAPNSHITPPDSAFNDPRSFENSGKAFLGVVEQYVTKGTLDPKRPIVFYGFSTGGAVVTEATAEYCRKLKTGSTQKLDLQTVLGSPGGMLEMGGHEGMMKEAGKLAVPYFVKELLNDLTPKKFTSLLRDLKYEPEKIHTSVKLFTGVLQEIAHGMSNHGSDESLKDIIKNFREIGIVVKRFKGDWHRGDSWDKTDPEWKSAIREQKTMTILNTFLDLLPQGEIIEKARDHFRRSFILQPNHPFPALPTPAGIRAREDVGHDSTKSARNDINGVPIHIYIPEGDAEVPIRKFLNENDKTALGKISDKNEQHEFLLTQAKSRMHEMFPQNTENVHPHVVVGDSTHHLTTRQHAGELEILMLHHLFPDLSSKLSKQM